MKKKMKMLLGTIVAMTMIVGSSMSVCAETTDICVDRIEIELPAYTEGMTAGNLAEGAKVTEPSVGATVQGPGYYYADYRCVYNGETCMSPSDVLQAGNIYTVYLLFGSTSGYYYANNGSSYTGDLRAYTGSVNYGTSVCLDNGCPEVRITYPTSGIVVTPATESSCEETASAPQEEATPSFVEETYVPEVVSKDTTALGKDSATVVPASAFNFSKFVSPAGFAKGVEKIADKKDATGSVTLFSDKAITINRAFLNTLTAKNMSVNYYFMHKGHLYLVTIPAGVDPDLVLDAHGHGGPLTVGAILGTSRMIQ